MSENNYQKWLDGELGDSDLSHRQVGVFQERERIIKLLENAIDHDWKGSEPCEACDQTNYLIALIKGENTIYLSDKDYEQLSNAIEGEQK